MTRDTRTADDLTVEPLSESNVDDLGAFLETVDARFFGHANAAAARRFLNEQRDVHILGRSRGNIVAFGMLRGWEEGYEVPSLGIAVGRMYEGRGYGMVVMSALEGIARERNVKRIRLRVDPDNQRAVRLYERCGFVREGVERGQSVMILDLTGPPD